MPRLRLTIEFREGIDVFVLGFIVKRVIALLSEANQQDITVSFERVD